jgi:hypothetical protein
MWLLIVLVAGLPLVALVTASSARSAVDRWCDRLAALEREEERLRREVERLRAGR